MTYACVSLCSIMIPIVACNALSELNTHIIKNKMCQNCKLTHVCQNRKLTHILAHSLSLDTTLTACHHAQHWTCASIDTARVQQHDASHVKWETGPFPRSQRKKNLVTIAESVTVGKLISYS